MKHVKWRKIAGIITTAVLLSMKLDIELSNNIQSAHS